MSIEVITNEATKFLNSPSPEVLAIHGEWGNGKTYFWNKTLRSNKISSEYFTKYSYVSLFGINSSEDLRSTIFTNTLPLKDIEKQPSHKNIQKTLLSKMKGWRSWAHKISKGFPYIRDFGAVINSTISCSIRDTIICLDDLERKGSKLTINEILGLICLLKDQQNCKVVIIYNEDSIDGEHKIEFTTLKEKVIDKDIEFNLTSEECCDIILSKQDKFHDLIKQNVIKLGIKNLRIINKITSLFNSLKDIDLSSYSEKEVARLLHSLCIFGYSFYSKNNTKIPPVEFLKNLGNKMIYQADNEEKNPQEVSYLSYLREYGYSHTDELDLMILKGIERGFFNAELHDEATKLKEQISKEDLFASLEKAWRIYHDSFDDNTQDVIDSLKNCYENYSKQIPVNYVDGMLNLFRQLGEQTLANEILIDYISLLKQNKKVINQENYPFFDSLKDAELIRSLQTLEQENEPEQSIEEILDKISQINGWTEHHIKFLAKCTIKDYVKVFKVAKGKLLSSYINTCLRFENTSPPKEEYTEISKLAKLALKEIAKETPLNRARVSRFGINKD